MSVTEFLKRLKYASGESKLKIEGNFCYSNIVALNRPILLAFSNMGVPIDEDTFFSEAWQAWGAKVAKDNHLNIISFSCFKNDNWFRCSGLFEFIENLGCELAHFPERLGYGGSMGGYAVGAFSKALLIDRLLLINPITTLNRTLAPWETRFKEFWSLDWDGRYNDGAFNNLTGYIVYDPLFNLDSNHAKRYGSNLTHLKCPGVGHAMPKHLLRLGVLKELFRQFVNNEVDTHWFSKKVRNRKLYVHYYDWLLSSQNIHLSANRKKVIEKHRRAVKAYLDDEQTNSENELVNLMRDAAFELETTNTALSLRMLEYVLKMRPKASLVRKKYNEILDKV